MRILETGLSLLLLATLAATGCSRPSAREIGGSSFVLAVTTSLESSGMLEVLRSRFEERTGIEVQPAVVGSGRALRMLEEGRADVVITHSPAAERELVARIGAEIYRPFMFNRFLIAGPAANPAAVQPDDSPAEALGRIHRASARFASRGDESGTHLRELDLWNEAGVDPSTNPGYVGFGQGMSALLRSAHETASYVLTDQASFEQFRGMIDLVPLSGDHPGLRNTYTVMLPRGKGPRHGAARRFGEWLLSAEGGMIIEGHRVGGKRLFFLTGENTSSAPHSGDPPVE